MLSYPGFMRYSFDICYRNGWGADQVDLTTLATRGDVLICSGQSEPPAEHGPLVIVVLHDDGGAASLWDQGRLVLWSSAEQSTPFTAVPGRLCREFLADQNIETWLTDPSNVARGSQHWAYTLLLAYWFLEGEPARMDIDGNGIPCETLFPPEVVADVWAGDF